MAKVKGEAMRLSRISSIGTVVLVMVGAAVGAVSVTSQAAAAGCSVAYQDLNAWQSSPTSGGFNTTLAITNLGDPFTHWTLTFTLPSGQTRTGGWNATYAGATSITATDIGWNGSIGTGQTNTSVGLQGSWTRSTGGTAPPNPFPAPTNFALNGVACTGGVPSPPPSPSPTPSASPSPSPTASSRPPHSMGFIGCSMAENVAQGYVADGGSRMWGPYGTGGLVVQSWTDPNSAAWQKFDQQAGMFGKPNTVWVQICIFANPGATFDEVKKLIANARLHAAPAAAIIVSGMPLYDAGHVCSLAGAGGPELTDSLARQAAADTTQHVTYPGQFHLHNNEVLSDTCHANTAGQASLGRQAIAFWG